MLPHLSDLRNSLSGTVRHFLISLQLFSLLPKADHRSLDQAYHSGNPTIIRYKNPPAVQLIQVFVENLHTSLSDDDVILESMQ